MPDQGSAVSRRPRRDDALSPPLFPLTSEEDSAITVVDRRTRRRSDIDDWFGVDPLAELAELDRRVQAAGGVPGRRTVEITGHTEDVYVPRRSRDSDWATANAPARSHSRRESVSFHPDRAAMWAIFLGLLLILVAAASAHAAVVAVALR